MSYHIQLYIKGLIDWKAKERYCIVLRNGRRSRPTDLKTALDAARGLLQRNKKCHVEDTFTYTQATFPEQLSLTELEYNMKPRKRKKTTQ